MRTFETKTKVAYNKSTFSKAKLTGQNSHRRSDFGCEALRSHSQPESLRIEAVILHSSTSAAEAKFLFHIRLHVSPRGWAVGQWHSSDIREWADDGHPHQDVEAGHQDTHQVRVTVESHPYSDKQREGVDQAVHEADPVHLGHGDGAEAEVEEDDHVR